jgi:hypothetical protein
LIAFFRMATLPPSSRNEGHRQGFASLTCYGVETAFPPAEVLVQIPQALRVSTDDLLGLKRLKEGNGNGKH